MENIEHWEGTGKIHGAPHKPYRVYGWMEPTLCRRPNELRIRVGEEEEEEEYVGMCIIGGGELHLAQLSVFNQAP